jgi:hypothetical protein
VTNVLLRMQALKNEDSLILPGPMPKDRWSLRFPQTFGFIPVREAPLREVFVAKEAVSSFIEEDVLHDCAEIVTPLPLRRCLLLIFLGSAVCYGLGFAVMTAFNHVLAVL